MLFSIDLLFEKIKNFDLQIFNANLFKANHVPNLSNSQSYPIQYQYVYICNKIFVFFV